jgi:DNA-directed RNA polymerase
LYWWKVGCANAFGFDKSDFESRVKWFDENEEWIANAGRDPYFEHGWRVADNPFQFLAYCIEYAKGDGISYLPVNMDGTCNGLQHLSAMTLDPVGGKAVNLLDSDEPQDIYTEVAEELKEQLKVDDEDGVNRQWCQLWQDKIDRKLVKSGTMTTPYGVSEYGMKDQILDQAKDKLEGYTVDKFKASVYLAEKLGESIRNVVVGARRTMDWFEAVVDESPQQFLRWRTPLTDFPVIQSYQRSKKKRVNLFVGSQRVQLHLQKAVNLPAEGKQKSGFSPNFVHSIDACMLMATISRLRSKCGATEFSLIHDSYGTHANHVDHLHKILREVFVEIYRNGDILQDIKEQLGATTEPPKNGELDVTEVLTSKYFFH